MRLLFVDPWPPEDRELYGFTTPQIGLSYLAAMALGAGHQVEVYDLQLLDNDVDGLEALARSETFDVIAMTMTTRQFVYASDLRRRLKEIQPGALFLAGGPHVTVRPEMTIERGGFDVGVIGEGEYVLVDLLTKLEAGEPVADVEGIVYRDWSGEVRRSQPRSRIPTLDELPMPALEVFGFPQRYTQFSMMTSRGCPANCSFCAARALWDTAWKFESPERVMQGVKRWLDEPGLDEVVFVDDTMNAQPKRFSNILDRLIELGDERGAPFEWSFWSRIDSGKKTDWQRAHEAGCRAVSFGIEAGSQKILDRVEKRLKVETMSEVIPKVQEHGIRVKTEWIVGLPGSFEEQLKSIELMKHLKPDWIEVHALVPLPGTPLGERPESFGIHFDEPRLMEHVSYNSIVSEDVLRYDYMSRAQMVELVERMEDTLRGLGYVTAREAAEGDKVFHTPNTDKPKSPLRSTAA